MSREKLRGRPFSYDQIHWLGKIILRDPQQQEKNLNFIRTLLKVGTVIETIHNDHARNLPMRYAVEGYPIEFLPHWRDYKLDDNNLYVPPTDQENHLLADIRAYTVWADRLANRPQPPR